MNRAATLVLLAVSGASSSLAATSITYYVNQAVGVGSVSGSIVTDGKIGVLGQADLLDWNLVLNDGAATFDLLGPLSGSNSEFFPAGVTGLSATSTQLLFNFSNGAFGISYPSLDYRVCFSSSICLSTQGSGVSVGIVTFINGVINANVQFTSLSGTQVIAATAAAPPAFFAGEVSLGSGVYYLQFPGGNVFGYYNFPSNSIFFHYDLGFEAFIPGSGADLYMYDFTSGQWWYTSSTLFPYLYDFALNSWLYYFPNTTNPRYFSNLTTGNIVQM